MRRFDGKVAIITGGAAGIGRSTALAFAREGASVGILDVLDKEGVETAALLKAGGAEVKFLHCNVADAQNVKSAIDEIVSTFGRLDYAFNNAGTEGVSAPTADFTEENWDRVIDINLKGVWLSMKYEIPYMLKQGGGSIVNNSSVAGLVGFAAGAIYTASKHGMIGLTKAASLDYIRKNIRINAVCPGIIHTAMIDRYTHGSKELEKQLIVGEPIGRMGKPEEIADAVLWLCSDAASFVTGIALPVDGGWVAM